MKSAISCRKKKLAGGNGSVFRQFSKGPMGLDPQNQGDARTKKHAWVCNEYLPTELASEEESKMGCAECCDCWCHFTFTNSDGTDREDAEALRAEIRQVEFGEQSHTGNEENRPGQLKRTGVVKNNWRLRVGRSL